jgi:YidC/Oxa1 family membrane protein insertase
LFAALIDGMTALINWLYHLTVSMGLPSYGIAIILLTILIKLLLHPITRIQMRSMAKMSQLQPEIKAIQDRYGKDKQQMQTKIMELYKERKVNPMSGCLLLLVQLPFMIALYQALWNFAYVNPAHAGFLWVENLSLTDPLFILPVLAAVTTFVQFKLTMSINKGGGNPSQEQMQKVMLTVMPVFIGWISATLPAGLSVYWVTFNLVSIVQQSFINKQILADRSAIEQEREKSRLVTAPAAAEVGAPTSGEGPGAKRPAADRTGKARQTSGKGKRSKEGTAQGEGNRRKRKKRGGGGRGGA